MVHAHAGPTYDCASANKPAMVGKGGPGDASPRAAAVGVSDSGNTGKSLICLQNLNAENDVEAYLNAFDRSDEAAGWPKNQWAALLIPCLLRLGQQDAYTIPAEEMTN